MLLRAPSWGRASAQTRVDCRASALLSGYATGGADHSHFPVANPAAPSRQRRLDLSRPSLNSYRLITHPLGRFRQTGTTDGAELRKANPSCLRPSAQRLLPKLLEEALVSEAEFIAQRR